MAESHIVTALSAKRAEINGHVHDLERKLAHHRIAGPPQGPRPMETHMVRRLVPVLRRSSRRPKCSHSQPAKARREARNHIAASVCRHRRTRFNRDPGAEGLYWLPRIMEAEALKAEVQRRDLFRLAIHSTGRQATDEIAAGCRPYQETLKARSEVVLAGTRSDT